MKRRVLIIGIDGGTWSILRTAIEQGYMPFLKSLCDAGSYGILKSTIPAITPAAWASFQTGMNPGKTGIFDFYFWDIKHKKKHFTNSQILQGTIWEIASQHGRRVGVINVPVTYPPKPINGYMITGFLTPSDESEFTYPANLKRELYDFIPNYHILSFKNVGDLAGKRFKSFVQEMTENIDNRAKAAEFIIDKESLDVLMVHFQATDGLQHKLWAYMEEGQPSFDTERRNYIFSNFYGHLDQKIEQLKKTFVKKTDTDCVTFIISDHGFQRNKKRFNLGKWLHQQGYLHFSQKFFWLAFVKDLLGKLDVLNLRKYIARRLKSLTGRMPSSQVPISWQRSKAFSVGSSSEASIYLLEEDEAKYQQTASELIAKLKEIKDPEDGTPIVKQVYYKEQIFSGDFLEFLPDLIIEPADGYSLVGYYKADVGLFQKITVKDDFHVGKHHIDGILVAAGNHIKHLENIKAHISDMAPTILYYLGLPIDENVDGRILKEIFPQQFLNQQRVFKSSQEKMKTTGRKTGEVHSEHEQHQIEERLRDLGYL